MEAVETFEGRHGLSVDIVPDDEPCGRDDLGDHLGTICEPHGWGDDRISPSYAYDSVADNIREKRLDGFTVLPIRSDDYGSSGGRMYVSDLDNANGFVYVSRAKLIEEYGSADEPARRKARRVLAAEVDEMDAILQGYVFGYIVRGPDDDHLDSCWGYVDREMTYIRAEAKDALRHAETAEDAERAEAAEMAARDILTV